MRKAVGGFWAALEEEDGLRGGREKLKRKRDREHARYHGTDTDGVEFGASRPAPPQRKRSRNRLRSNYSPDIVGAAGSSKGRSKDELNPTFVRLEELFITHEDGGLRIPLTAEESEMDESGASGVAPAAPPATNGSNGIEGKAGNEVKKSEIDNGSAVDPAVDDNDVAAIATTGEVKPAEASASGAAAEDAGAAGTPVPAAGSPAPAIVDSEPQAQPEPQEGVPMVGEVAKAAIKSASPKPEVPPQASEAAPAPAVAAPAQGEDTSMDVDADAAPAPEPTDVAPATQEEDGADAAAVEPPAATTEVAAPSSPSPSAAAAATAAATADPDSAPVATAATTPSSMLLPPSSQREIMLAALSCLSDLEADSREYATRLEELRGRLAAVGRKRGEVWRALRIWAVRRVEREWEEREERERERGGLGSGSGSGMGEEGQGVGAGLGEM